MAKVSNEAKTIGIVAYLTLIGALIAITMNVEPKHDFGRFHARQALGLHLGFIFCALFLSLLFSWFEFNIYLWASLYVFYFVLWIYGFAGALQSRKTRVPILGKWFQNWFTFVK